MKVRTLARGQGAGSWTLAATAAAALACAGPHAAHAQEATRIVAATVYPDSAGVERELKVPGGTRHIVIACVPASVDVSTLQVDGDPEARLGDVRATGLPESRIEDCAPPVAKARREGAGAAARVLESQRDANDLAFAYLRNGASGAHADKPEPASPPTRGAAPAGVTRPGATAADLRRSALDLLTDQARVKRELAALALEETRVADDQPASKGKSGWRTLRFDVWTPAAATLRVRYNVAGTYWRPTYRAVAGHRAQHAAHRPPGRDRAGQRRGLERRAREACPRASRSARPRRGTPTSWWLDLVQAVGGLAGYSEARAPAPAPMSPAMMA